MTDTDIKKTFIEISADGTIDSDEHARMIALLDTYQKAIDAERAEAKEQLRQVQRNSFIVSLAIMCGSFAYIITVLTEFGISIDDI
ncbi:MAG: hypothetical protein Q6365_022255, partial [Candidatus Sigynarchaeota archaeon]